MHHDPDHKPGLPHQLLREAIYIPLFVIVNEKMGLPTPIFGPRYQAQAQKRLAWNNEALVFPSEGRRSEPPG